MCFSDASDEEVEEEEWARGGAARDKGMDKDGMGRDRRQAELADEEA